ncbi:hypothetical protein EJ06DRAFT_570224 [Trichodelitschia bisporula]|uniref:RRM domain-containing protein n=1 Tax=Trichodelitschia bisporula TaxID=703511 RepID=A0A6G1HJT2_9PEZI|nr:hypothetical protein EJ06DRAFT_570224 [Trichodelitschia bisporula]
MTTEVSPTRLYLGNLPRNATKADVEAHFASHGTGKITEVKLMNGFGFIEYEDAMDARDVVPDGSLFMGERLTVQFARGSRRNNEPFPHQERNPPRPRRTPHRMQITGLPVETSWQDLKDFARGSGLDVVFSEVSRDRDGHGFVEYETSADLRSAVEKLDNTEFKGKTVRCVADVSLFNASQGSPSSLVQPQEERPRDRFRSRSPVPRGARGYPPAPPDDYDYRRPRAYSPRVREDYRRRSPPPRDYYERDRYARSPPRGPPHRPLDDYVPRRPYDDPYGPPRSAPYDDPYLNGHAAARSSRPYPPPLSPRRRSSPVRAAGYEYDRQPRYW